MAGAHPLSLHVTPLRTPLLMLVARDPDGSGPLRYAGVWQPSRTARAPGAIPKRVLAVRAAVAVEIIAAPLLVLFLFGAARMH
jgi:hypothetical protein